MKNKNIKELCKEGYYDTIKYIVNNYDEKDTINWNDVKDELTTLEWGYLIEHNIIERCDNREFKISNKDNIKNSINNIDKKDVQEESLNKIESKIEFTKLDKIFLGFSSILVLGFVFDFIRGVIIRISDIFLSPLLYFDMIYILIILSLLTGLYSKMIKLKVINNTDSSIIRKEIYQLSKKEKEKEDYDLDISRKILKYRFQLFKIKFKSIGWNLIIALPIIQWLRYISLNEGPFNPVEIPFIGILGWSQSILGPLQLWLIVYIMFSILSTILISHIYNLIYNFTQT